MTARYRITEKSFFAPHMLEVGSIIETTAEPAQNWEALNDEAQSAKEAWYDKEVTVYNTETGKPETHKPHVNKRPVTPGEAIVAPKVELIRAPPKDTNETVIGLAEATAARGEPDLVPREDGTNGLRGAELPKDAEPVAESVDGETRVLAAAPAPKKDKI